MVGVVRHLSSLFNSLPATNLIMPLLLPQLFPIVLGLKFKELHDLGHYACPTDVARLVSFQLLGTFTCCSQSTLSSTLIHSSRLSFAVTFSRRTS